MTSSSQFIFAAMFATLFGGGVLEAIAQESRAESWTVEKCNRYKKAWSDALERFSRKGLGPEFIERHEAFLAGGCTEQPDVCPRSKEELDLANVLTIRAMNAGMGSTFLPFACRK
ncbi:hypothetical protein [Bosea sp. BK604]|uniref:hypothetical protein n=1 Tax=Bosea sp. BK604 TaxID=2512180 RepID=UPI00104B5B4E|nr:hypothetical protein [Bosea sp. BK604]TCR70675.1 hypothetical protein EV560_1011083 [Bosea sp. BK604]